MTHFRRFAIITVLAGLWACNKETPTESTSETPTSTSGLTNSVYAPNAVSLGVGDSAQIKFIAMRTDSTQLLVTTAASWQSGDSAVATVSASGIITGVAAGTANVTATFDGLTATVAVTVSSASTSGRTFSGVAVRPAVKAGTLTLFFGLRVTGWLYLESTMIDLSGRLDEATRVIHLTGGGLSLLGTLSGNVVAGTISDSNGASGSFAVLESTHVAVTPACGTYTSNGLTTAGGADAGPFAIAVALDDSVAAVSTPADGAGPPLSFLGRRTAETVNLTSGVAGTLTGTVRDSEANGVFSTGAGSAATFSAKTEACP